MEGDELVLIGPTIVLRVPGEPDVVPLWGAVHGSIDELRPWMNWFHDDYSEADVRSWVNAVGRGYDAGDDFNFVITRRGAGTVLGACGLNQVDVANRRANLGYWVRTAEAGHGVATEAAALVAHWALKELGLNRLEVVVAVTNAPSLRVADKLGAVREGVARSRFWLHDVTHDAVVFSLISADLAVAPAIVGGGRDEGVSFLA